MDFEAASCALNLYQGRSRARTFAGLILGECSRFGFKPRILDVGCGAGLGSDPDTALATLSDIRETSSELWACEPDESVRPNELFSQFARGPLESASLPESYFDIIYAHYVVEHVSEPQAFLERAYRLLRPGGKFIFMTPNGRHYFVRVARVVANLGLEEILLRRIHPQAASVHYPTRYLLNDPSVILQLACEAGFSKCDFAFFEHGDVRGYFRSGLRVVPIVIEQVLARFGNPALLPGLVARLRK